MIQRDESLSVALYELSRMDAKLRLFQNNW